MWMFGHLLAISDIFGTSCQGVPWGVPEGQISIVSPQRTKLTTINLISITMLATRSIKAQVCVV